MLGNTQQALERFSKGVIKQSRTNLSKKDKNVTRSLYDSLAYDLIVSQNSFSLSFLMDSYGKFQDEGVKGADPSKVKGKNAIKGQQAPNSRFKFGSGNFSGSWDSFVDKIESWAKRRNLRFRDEKGQFKKGSMRSFAQVVANNIYARGIKPSRFFTRAFETQFAKLPKEIATAYKLDLENFLKFTQK